MMTEEQTAMFAAATREYVSKHWETVRMLDGVDVGGLPLVDRAVLRFVMSELHGWVASLQQLAARIHCGDQEV